MELSLSKETDIILQQLNEVIIGKPQKIKMSLACLLGKGHLLIEDLPGMGKTTLSHALASILGLSYQRVQFTADMLPADLLGVSIFDQTKQNFVFHQGPLFTQVLLADEINRGSPRTQSALLEAMAEQQVSMDGTTYPLEDPFFVIATQNPQDQSGTFPLPESQLDRFLMRIEIGFPSKEAERLMLLQAPLKILEAQINANQLIEIQDQVSRVKASESVLNYLLALVHESRVAKLSSNALSPRASRGLLSAAKAWAFLDNRDYLLPDDLQIVFPAVAEHRLRSGSPSLGGQATLSRTILETVEVIR